MRYLFFDIECCDGEHICEFGYVITDTNFQILEKEDITINPDHKFNLVGRPGGRDLYLFYPESTYFKSFKFPYFYEKIKNIIEYKDQIIVGHAISNDAKFLRTACKDYGLAPINFDFADSQKIYSEYFNIKKEISLEDAGNNLDIEIPKYLHKSDEDSEMTMLFVQKLCNNLNCTLDELISLCDTCTGYSKNFNITYLETSLPRILKYAKESPNKISQSKKERTFMKIATNEKYDKTVSFATGILKNYFASMLKIAKYLKNKGYTFTSKVSDSNIFIKYDEYDEQGNLKECMQLQSAKTQIDEGKEMSIYDFNAFVQSIGLEEKQIEELPFPLESDFKTIIKDKRRRNRQRKPLNYTETSSGTTLGELLKAQGFDIEKLKGLE